MRFVFNTIRYRIGLETYSIAYMNGIRRYTFLTILYYTNCGSCKVQMGAINMFVMLSTYLVFLFLFHIYMNFDINEIIFFFDSDTCWCGAKNPFFLCVPLKPVLISYIGLIFIYFAFCRHCYQKKLYSFTFDAYINSCNENCHNNFVSHVLRTVNWHSKWQRGTHIYFFEFICVSMWRLKYNIIDRKQFES